MNDYYIHEAVNYYKQYFCRLGNPIKVSYSKYLRYKLFGYQTTVAPKGLTLTEVLVRGVIELGCHPKSWRVEQILKHGHDLA